MDKIILGVLAGFDRYTEEYISGIQQKLYTEGFVGEQTKDIPMHITLGLYDAEKEAEMREFVSRTAKNTASFDISFSHIGIFGGSKTIFIAPDTGKELLSLKERFDSISYWVPHTTLLIDTPETIYKALPIVAGAFKPLTGRVEYLYLYKFWPANLLCAYKLYKRS